MKKLLIATAVAATLFAPQAFAQAKNFAGWSIAGTLENTKTETNTGTTFGTKDATSTNLQVQGGYAWALGDSFVLGLNLGLGFGENKAGDFATASATNKARAAWSIEPGFAVSNTTLVYGKFTLNGATYSEPGIEKTETGTGYGIGARFLMNKNVFLQAGYDVVSYNAAYANLKQSSSALSFGVGYKF
jgi:outer membrane immunogenic protein